MRWQQKLICQVIIQILSCLVIVVFPGVVWVGRDFYDGKTESAACEARLATGPNMGRCGR
jgi:hypothetical protein